MAEIPNFGFGMGYDHKETSDFVALDVGDLTIAAAADKDLKSTSSPRFIKSFSRKGSLRLGGENKKSAPAMEGDATALPISGGVHGGGEKHDVAVHVAPSEESSAVSQVTSPTCAGPTKYRRLGSSRRASAPWLGPRRVLFAFATLSSMGTLILLYFTLSMGKMSGGDADAR